MKQTQQFTALIERKAAGYGSLCPELDIASQGETVEEARKNLIAAIEFFFEVADPSEITLRLKSGEGWRGFLRKIAWFCRFALHLLNSRCGE